MKIFSIICRKFKRRRSGLGKRSPIYVVGMLPRGRHDQNVAGRSVTPPTKEGQLMKYRNFWAGWSPRFFKLDKCYLHYFETKYAPEPIDSIPRSCVVAAKVSEEFPDRQFVFEIQQKSGTVWYAQASSMQEMIDWLRVFSPIPTMIDPRMYPTSVMPDSRQMTQPNIIPSAPEITTATTLYPVVPHNGSYNHEGTVRMPGFHESMPPPAYSEIMNINERRLSSSIQPDGLD